MISDTNSPSMQRPTAARWMTFSAASPWRARAAATARRCREKVRQQLDRELESHRSARLSRLLPHRLGHRPILRSRGYPDSRARLRGEQRRLLLPRHHRRRCRGWQSALRALPFRRPRRLARHRSRPAQPGPPRARHPGALSSLRPRRRGDDGQLHHLPRQERGARNRQSAQPAGKHVRAFLAAFQQWRLPAHPRVAGAAPAGRHPERTPAHAGFHRALPDGLRPAAPSRPASRRHGH